MENKTLTRATILIATFLLAIPLTPVWAATPAHISVSSPAADIGQAFTASVNVAGAPNLLGYDITIQYNPDVLTANSATLSGGLFDPATHNVLIVRQDNFPAIGYLRYALVILGGGSVSTDGSVLFVNFQVNDPSAPGSLATASEYPSAISIAAAQLPSLNPSGGVYAAPFTSTDGSYMPPALVGLRSVGCRANNNGFNTQAKGFTDPLFCRLINTGSTTITARGDFNYQSLGGLSGSLSGQSITLGPGAAGQATSALTVHPHTNDVFSITGTGTRTITFQDGSVLAIPNTAAFNGSTGGSVVFQVTVISP
ncbi:MAG TPA: cohesin domain-containing protein [Candidatus Binatus sp.]|nr:cohesin domain-containing protein [Candidatus Binatus sp.]